MKTLTGTEAHKWFNELSETARDLIPNNMRSHTPGMIARIWRNGEFIYMEDSAGARSAIRLSDLPIAIARLFATDEEIAAIFGKQYSVNHQALTPEGEQDLQDELDWDDSPSP